MAYNRHATQQYLEQENNAYIEELLHKTRGLNSVAKEINIEIRESCDDIDKIVRQKHLHATSTFETSLLWFGGHLTLI